MVGINVQLRSACVSDDAVNPAAASLIRLAC